MSPRQTAIQNGDIKFIQFCEKCDKDTEHYVSGGCICKSSRLTPEQENRRKQYEGSEERKKQRTKSTIKCKYNGMTPEDWLRMYNKQGGKCLIPSCNFAHHAKWWEQGHEGFHVHHDHDTKEVIGLLCHECNKAEGHINKDPIRTQDLIDMKELHENRNSSTYGIIRGTLEGSITRTKSKDGIVTWSEPTITKSTHRLITL